MPGYKVTLIAPCLAPVWFH